MMEKHRGKIWPLFARQRPHNKSIILQKMDEIGFEMVDHPLYFQYLTPPDYYSYTYHKLTYNSLDLGDLNLIAIFHNEWRMFALFFSVDWQLCGSMQRAKLQCVSVRNLYALYP